MKIFIIFLIANLIFAPMSNAYPEDQLNECIISAKKNPAIKDVSDSSIESFCDCSLKSIIDEGLAPLKAGNECAQKSFKRT